MKKLYLFIAFIYCLQLNSFAQNFWEKIGGPCGGNIVALAINSKDYIFIAGYENGIFRSTNNGENWTQVNNGLPKHFPYIQCLVVGSNNYIYAGAFGSGVFRSTDNGENWNKISDISIRIFLH